MWAGLLENEEAKLKDIRWDMEISKNILEWAQLYKTMGKGATGIVDAS